MDRVNMSCGNCLALIGICLCVLGCDDFKTTSPTSRGSRSGLDRLVRDPPSNLSEEQLADRIAAYYPRQKKRAAMSHYERVHAFGVNVLPSAVAMQRKFPSTDHFITHFGFKGESPNTWNTESNFGGRYTLTMQVEILIDYERETFSLASQPNFYLVEIASVARDGNTSYGKQFKFGLDKFNSLVASGWDFSSIGITIKTGVAPNWTIYESMLRSPRYPIRLESKEE